MEAELGRLIDAQMPPINPELGHGYAVQELAQAPAYIDKILNALRLHERVEPHTLRYKGIRDVPPEQVAKYHDEPSRTFDFARSDIYPIRLVFEMNGVEFYHDISMVFANDGGIIHMSGSKYYGAPVLADKIISVGSNTIFVRLNRAKLNFNRSEFPVNCNGHTFTGQIVHSVVYNHSRSKAKGKSLNHITSLAHYLFAKHGVREAFMQYCNVTPIVRPLQEFTDEEFPRSEWNIFSNNEAGASKSRALELRSSNLAMAIRKSEMNTRVEGLVIGYMYLAKRFPDRIIPVEGEWDNKWLMQVLLGNLIFDQDANTRSDGMLQADVASHIQSLDEYIDAIVEMEFAIVDLPIKDIYGLFVMIIDNFSSWVKRSHVSITSMYDKRFTLLPFLLEDLIQKFNRLYFDLRKKGLHGKDYTFVQGELRKKVTRGSIFYITKGRGEVQSLSHTGDNKLTRVVTSIVSQEDTGAARRKNQSTSATSDPSKFLNASLQEVASPQGTRKNEPTGRSRVNPFVKTENGFVVRNPKLIPILDRVQEMISRT